MPRFVPRQRKQKGRQRDTLQKGDCQVNSNQIQILPLSKKEKDEKDEKRRKLREELKGEQSSISAKEQKRLNKYIENKLKKDENLELLKKLSQVKYDTSQLQSSKNLGKRKHAEFVAGGSSLKDDLAPAQAHAHSRPEDFSDSDLDSLDSFELRHENPSLGHLKTEPQYDIQPSNPAIVQGSGLRQQLTVGNDGLPVINTRRKISTWKDVSDDSWEGFDTDSDNEELSLADQAGTGPGGLAGGSDTETDTGSAEDDDGTLSESGITSDESSQDGDQQGRRSKIAPRVSAFKSWATQQINESLGFIPSKTSDYVEASKSAAATAKTIVPNPAPENGVIEEAHTSGRETGVYNVLVTRTADIEALRRRLPIVAEEQKIMEAIHNNPCVIVWGTTGSGKTTQVPQFLFEAGYGSPLGPTPGMIGITQPRRVAAVSMAKRVGEELGQHAEKVSYQIRFETTTSMNSAIKFMTDGILLREISKDFALLKYSVIIVDEAHERSVNTDILIGMLSRILELRRKMRLEDSTVKPLKVVIMSATLRVSDFLNNANLFPTALPPLVQAEGRQFPVTTHFARRTERAYLEEAFRKICRGHRKLPSGGILVFLTGQNEIKSLLKRLQGTFRSSNRSASESMRVQCSASDAPLEADDLDLGAVKDMEIDDEESEVELHGHDGEDEEDLGFDIGEPVTTSSSVHVLPLYSQLPTKEQVRVFDAPPHGSRLIVLATNVAETSLTIPGIRYVIDCGRSKERVYNQSTGIQKFEITWISKASAEQRAGRAGRTGPGHCYRLYSSAVYERDFAEHAEPEILRTPIESVVLQMKSMGLDNVVKFPFPTPPERVSIVRAEKLLKSLGALTSAGRITQLGRSLSIYPLSPRYGKMLAIGSQYDCLPYVIALVSGLAEGDVFVPENQADLSPKDREEDEVYTNEDRLEDTVREQRRKDYNRARAVFSKHDRSSDALKLLSAICAYAYAEDGDSFCREMFLRSKAMVEISQLRKQLTDIVRANYPQSIGAYTARLPSPSPVQLKALNQIVAAGFIDQVAIRADLSPDPPLMTRKPKRALDMPYLALSPTRPISNSQTCLDDQAVYLHPSSILTRLTATELPQYVIYSHLQESSPSTITPENQQHHHHNNSQQRGAHSKQKTRMFPLTAIGGGQLSALAHDTPLLSYGKPIGKIVSLGGLPERREVWVVPFLRAEGEGGAGVGWPLPARKVVQTKDAKAGGGWVVEKFLS